MQCILTKNTLYKYRATCINIGCFAMKPQQVTELDVSLAMDGTVN